MIKRKKRIIMYMAIIVMMTIGMGRIGDIALAENQKSMEEQNNDVAVASEGTPDEYFEIEVMNENLQEAKIKRFKTEVTPSIAEVNIPKTIAVNNVTYTVTSIGNNAFRECENIEYVVIPDTVKIIGNYAFSGCSALELIEIPDSVTFLDSSFGYCSSLKTIKLSNSLEYIASHIFAQCTSLESITIPNLVIEIGYSAFSNCTSLKTIIIPNKSISFVDSTPFGDSPVEKLIIICQDVDNMIVPDDSTLRNILKDNTDVYRVAMKEEIETDETLLESYEYMGYSVPLREIFKSTVIYKGMSGTEEYIDNDIVIEKYFPVSYRFEGEKTSSDTKIENNTLYIGKDEDSSDLSIQASIETPDGNKTKIIPIKIVKAESVSIKEKPTKSIYDVGNEYKPDGLVITLTYEDGYEKDIEYSENDHHFDFKHKKLKFDTKEQEIRYRRFKVTHPLIVYGEVTLSASNIKVTGTFSNNCELKIDKVEEDSMIYESLDDNEIIADYDIEIEGDYTRSDKLQIEFGLENELNGKKVSIRHLKQDGVIEEFEETVSKGKIIIEVNHLSPFIIYTEKEIIEEPETPIIPKPDVLDIKPNEPIPEIPVIDPNDLNKPIQSTPHNNQSLQNTVLTEDNNPILLWEVLSIVGMSIVIIFTKKKKE